MSAKEPLHVLEATGYLASGQPAPGVYLDDEARSMRRGRAFLPDALWRGPSALTVYFKFEPAPPDDQQISTWRQEIWNEGFAPLLWVISPEQIDLYNGFGRPLATEDSSRHRLWTFRNIDAALDELDALAGRLAMETGQFWREAPSVDRATSVDQQLLSDLALLEDDLISANLDRSEAQGLIGRSIFTQYLIDRKIVKAERLQRLCGHRALPPILSDRAATEQLFAWLSDTFNGDMFPPSTAATTPGAAHLRRVAEFLDGVDPETGQTTLFPYQFDIIPVELISSIYEQFAHATSAASPGKPRPTEATRSGVFYTRLSVVSLVLDEVMDGLTGKESVLDLTCGSGVFLVEALRRLVHIRSGGSPPTRELIRSTLYEQVYGVDISEAAVRIAAFSLYLAALELDPDPQPPQALRFRPLIGETLVVGDARNIETSLTGEAALMTRARWKKFDVIVGNPPWSFKGHQGTAARRRSGATSLPLQPRGESLDFVLCAVDFAHDRTRFGLILSATSFFSRSQAGLAASRHVMQLLSPVTLVNLANLSAWLFPAAKMPAVALFARHRPQRADQVTVVQVPWSPSGDQSHTFEIAPSDIMKLSLADWTRQPDLLKAAAYGRRRDMLLLDRLATNNTTLDSQLELFEAKLSVGLKFGNRSSDADSLRGLPLLVAKDLRPFSVPDDLPLYDGGRAERPRDREIYRAPLLLVKEFLRGGPRPVVAVTDRDILFTDAYFGATLPPTKRDAAYLLAAILSSALASWFFIMTASSFGLWMRRLLRQDVVRMPIPDLETALQSEAGRRVLHLESVFQRRTPGDGDWKALDESILDLYGLDEADRIVIRDGHFQASWQWKQGLYASVQPADIEQHVLNYARTFLATIDAWLSARNCRRMRAEVFNLPQRAPVRVIRFVLEDKVGPSSAEIVDPNGELGQLLARIGERLKVRLANSLIGQRELRVHGRNEIVIIKPAAHRHWMGVSALEDADAVIAESFSTTVA